MCVYVWGGDGSGGGGGGGGFELAGCQGGCKRRIEVFVKIVKIQKKKQIFLGRGDQVGRSWGGVSGWK